MKIQKHSALLAVLALVLASCQSTSERLQRIHESMLTETHEAGIEGTLSESYAANQNRRLETVRDFVAHGEIQSTDDKLLAAAVLVTSYEMEDLALAENFGLEAATAGEERGFRIAAIAIDKQLVRRGLPQKYGTQFEYSEVFGEWRLYPVDPRTTDQERTSMGLPARSELEERARALNDR